MVRYFAPAIAIALLAGPAFALRVAGPLTPLQRTFQADAVVVGKVTAIEDDLVEAPAEKGSEQKLAYKIAVVKVDSALVGAAGLTHVKIGFVPEAVGGGKPVRPGLRRGAVITLAERHEGCFFLRKHPTAAFYILSPMAPPLDATADNYAKQLDMVKKALAAVEAPAKSLQAEKADDRYFAAASLIAKYRTFPANAAEIEQVPVSQELSSLLLKALTERDWTKFEEGLPQPVQVMYSLGLNDNDGFKPAPFNGKGDYNAVMKAEFEKWLAGPGAKYAVKQIVLKEKK